MLIKLNTRSCFALRNAKNAGCQLICIDLIPNAITSSLRNIISLKIFPRKHFNLLLWTCNFMPCYYIKKSPWTDSTFTISLYSVRICASLMCSLPTGDVYCGLSQGRLHMISNKDSFPLFRFLNKMFSGSHVHMQVMSRGMNALGPKC